MTMNEWLYATPSWLIIGTLFMAFLALLEGGFRLGRMRSSQSGPSDSQSPALEASILTLFGLLLGFSFSMAENRFELRKNTLMEEANAIGTAYLRASALPLEASERIRHDLRRYAAARIEFYQSQLGDTKETQANTLAETLQGQFWSAAAAEARRSPTAIAASMLAALNEVIDLREKQRVAFESMIPATVLCFLFAISLLAMLAVGYLSGVAGRRPTLLALMFSVVIAMTLFLVLDLDRPRRGLIQLQQGSLLRLQESMRQ